MSENKGLAAATAMMHRRLLDEVDELTEAVSSSNDAMILDELVDVTYYVRKLAACRGISDDVLQRYAMVKSSLRENGIRDKRLELRMATDFVES